MPADDGLRIDPAGVRELHPRTVSRSPFAVRRSPLAARVTTSTAVPLNKPRTRRAPRPIDAAGIDSAARTYLTRYFTSRAHLRRLLMRRVDKSILASGGERAVLAAAVDATLDRLVEEGALNDEIYARDKVRSLVRRGVSEAGVHQRLASRGLGGDRVRAGLEAVRESGADPALSAVCAFVRRRRMGPYRIDDGARIAQRTRDLAALGRAGFSYALARRALDMATVEEVEALLLG